jgi:hypothetical protein
MAALRGLLANYAGFCKGCRNDGRSVLPAVSPAPVEVCKMKTPDTTKAVSSVTRQGAHIIGAGGFPVKQNTVIADVLARLLTGERLTSLDTVYEASTTRLGAVVFSLVNKYGWQIESIDKAAGCKDGRVAWVSEYFLSNETRTHTLAAGAEQWCATVRAARTKRRAHAAQARREANRANAARNAYRQQPKQWGLFGTEQAYGERS